MIESTKFAIIKTIPMKNRLFLFFLLPICSANAQKSESFPNLTKINFDNSFKSLVFGYDAKTVRLINQFCTSLPKNDFWYCSPDEGVQYTKLAKFANDKIKDSLDILFTNGASDDPEYVLANKSGKVVGSVNAIEFYINEQGVVYTSGHTNNMFNKRRKFQLTQDTLTEVKQAFYYVGLKSKTTAPITLYKSKTGNEVVANVPQDYQIEVLLCEYSNEYLERFFLVRTEFGLVGWLRLKDNSEYNTGIEGLTFAGD